MFKAVFVVTVLTVTIEHYIPLPHPSMVVQSKAAVGTAIVPSVWQTASDKPAAVSPTTRCAAGLPRGCSCSKNDGFSSITCSGVRLTSVPKNWVDAGNSIVKTLNLERNIISEVLIPLLDVYRFINFTKSKCTFAISYAICIFLILKTSTPIPQ